MAFQKIPLRKIVNIWVKQVIIPLNGWGVKALLEANFVYMALEYSTRKSWHNQRHQLWNLLFMHRIFWPVNSYLYSMTTPANLQHQMLETPCSVHLLYCAWTYKTYCNTLPKQKKIFPTANNDSIVFTCFGFCNRKTIKHPVTLDLAPFQI